MIRALGGIALVGLAFAFYTYRRWHRDCYRCHPPRDDDPRPRMRDGGAL